ncbi:MAG: hypothetical protein COV44_07655 [Deltaproteobacteria bacterium CG11_big_fil_rev_8_21_14_0_20_45_16]|nr:MAG: hypothetical protein COV44_07655 [Deltaproteobacteria bacterium CG11_big_fil_rev_8_21_14_0_20_45_16]
MLLFALISLVLISCESTEISMTPKETEIQVLVPEPESWSYARFKHEWTLASDTKARTEVLSELGKHASINFEWDKFWKGFETGETSWPTATDNLDGQLIGFASAQCNLSAMNAFEGAALRFLESSENKLKLRMYYYDQAFGLDRSCSVPVERNHQVAAFNWLLEQQNVLELKSFRSHILQAIDQLHRTTTYDNNAQDIFENIALSNIQKLVESYLRQNQPEEALPILIRFQKMAQLSKSAKRIAETLARGFFVGPKSFESLLQNCRNSSTCESSSVMNSLDLESDATFSQYSSMDVKEFLKIIATDFELRTKKISEASDAKMKINDAQMLLDLGDRLAKFRLTETLQESFEFASSLDSSLTKAIHRLPDMERAALAEWIFPWAIQTSTPFAAFQTYKLTRSLKGLEPLFQRVNSASTYSQKIFRYRLVNSDFSQAHEIVVQNRNEWCRFLESAGFKSHAYEKFEVCQSVLDTKEKPETLMEMEAVLSQMDTLHSAAKNDFKLAEEMNGQIGILHAQQLQGRAEEWSFYNASLAFEERINQVFSAATLWRQKYRNLQTRLINAIASNQNPNSETEWRDRLRTRFELELATRSLEPVLQAPLEGSTSFRTKESLNRLRQLKELAERELAK